MKEKKLGKMLTNKLEHGKEEHKHTAFQKHLRVRARHWQGHLTERSLRACEMEDFNKLNF